MIGVAVGNGVVAVPFVNEKLSNRAIPGTANAVEVPELSSTKRLTMLKDGETLFLTVQLVLYALVSNRMVFADESCRKRQY